MKTFVIAAITADGFIGRTSSHFPDWTGKADKKIFVELTKEAGVMVMGARTYATIGRPLPGRKTIVYTPDLDDPQYQGVETTTEAPADLVRRIAATGAHGLAICGGASMYSQFMQAGVVDELYLSVVPKLFGAGVALFGNELDVDLELLESRALDGQTILLHYCVLSKNDTNDTAQS